MKAIAVMALALMGLSAFAAEFDANGKRLDPEPERHMQYQWTDSRTGKRVVKDYPPANIPMSQVGRSADGWTIYLEESRPEAPHSNFASAVQSGSMPSNPNGGLRESEVWLATERERKAAEEAERKLQAAREETERVKKEYDEKIARHQREFDNLIKLETVKALYAPKVIVLKR